MVVTYLALGSNLGDREFYLKNAIHGLEARGIRIVRAASIFESEPKDVGLQPWYLNTIVEAQTTISPQELLDVCLAVERENQRERLTPGAARTLDIDIVFYGNRIIREPGLTIPHPRWFERKFVLMPLAEIAPGLIDPQSGETVATLLGRCSDASEIRLRQ